jgi:hypothetical protein
MVTGIVDFLFCPFLLSPFGLDEQPGNRRKRQQSSIKNGCVDKAV